MINPLLDSSPLPSFSAIRPKHIIPAIKFVLNCCYKTVEQVVNQSGSFNWDNLCQPLAEADDYLGRVWSPVSHLNAVKNNPALRTAYETSLLLLSEYSTWIRQHQELYKAYCNLRDGDDYHKLNVAQKKTVDDALRDFQLSGIHLSLETQKRYGQIVTRLSELGSVYNNNLLDATMGWSKLVTDEKTLSGLPDSWLLSACAQANARDQKGWLLTLDASSYLPVLTYCDNSELRKELYWAYHTRASDQGPHAGKWDNGPIINEILALRHTLAQILGFKNYAEQSLSTKMARDPQKVLAFLTDLVKLSRPQGAKEVEQLRAFAKREFGCNTLDLWDIAYYGEKQKQHLFSINDEELRSYFPEKRVISGLFEVIKRIYGMTAKERTDVDIWHPDVRFFDLFDERSELRGSFYLDLYARDNKREGAWMNDCVGMMRKTNGTLQKPVAYLICNFQRPIGTKPVLFTHNDVTTFFHEFGHVLHHILTRIDISGVSGINGVPWDAVELPSQFMENFCWQSEALAFISGHYESGESLPPGLLKRLLDAKNYQASLFILRQLELALFDFQMHYKYSPQQGARVLETLAEVKEKVGVMPTVTWSRFPNVFSHIFSGGYAAGYYSYLWANVLAADVWSRFEEEGILNREIGELFLENILSRGGSEEPMVLFVRFRGREPKLDAMLRYFGIGELLK